MIDHLVDASRRTLLASLLATLGNMALLTVWQNGLEAFFDLRWGYWGYNPIGGFAFIYFMTYLMTAFGLALLVLLTSAFPVPSNRIVAQLLFVAAGGLLGAGMFVWSTEPMFFGACGALTASVFALWPIRKKLN
ncbi:MAG: hypothetical protein AAFW59_04815 [Pseudomonadota bacterium]